MKKTQRARLAALLAQDKATHTAADLSELAALQTLAAAHPNAALDLDEPVATAPAPTVVVTAPTLLATLKGALSTLGNKAQLGIDLATRTTERDTARTELATRTTELATATSQLTALTSQLGSFAAFFGLKPADLAGKDAAGLSAILADKISAQAIEALAGAGVPQAALPAPTKTEATGGTLEEIRAQMSTEKDPEKLGLLGAKAIKLREAAWSKN